MSFMYTIMMAGVCVHVQNTDHNCVTADHKDNRECGPRVGCHAAADLRPAPLRPRAK